MPFKNPHPLYTVWHSMKERCRNKNLKQWRDYGGRGIRVCERWLEPKSQGFRNFVADMGDRPDGYTLDRIDNNGDYTPQNCRWATRKEQQKNRAVTRRVVIEGREYLAVELAESIGVKTDTILERAAQNISLSEVLSTKRRVFTPGLALGGLANGARQKAKTHCPHGHEYNEENTALTPQGFRRCKACHRIKEAARNAAKRAICCP